MVTVLQEAVEVHRTKMVSPAVTDTRHVVKLLSLSGGRVGRDALMFGSRECVLSTQRDLRSAAESARPAAPT
jgi:hypothetical protein